MNWTGGRLSRHSRAKGGGYSLTNQQKEHFAKVEANLRGGGQKNSPLKWSIFGNLVERHLNRRSTNGNREHSREESQPLRPHHTHQSNAEPPPSRKSREHILQVKNEQISIPDDDLYNATPPPPKEKRRREESHIPSEQGQKEDTTSEKRRRLLQKSDWVGISTQQPTSLAFRYPEHGEDVGRRRKIPDGHRARHNSKQTRIESPFVTRRRNISPKNPHDHQQPRAQGRSDVRISIGGRIVPPGVSSSTAPSRRHQNPDYAQYMEYSQTASSDVMLLDNDTAKPEEANNADEVRDEELADTSENMYDPLSGYLEESSLEDVYDANANKTHNLFHQDDHTSEPHTARRGRDNRSNVIEQPQSPLLRVFTSSSASIYHPKPRSSRVSLLLRSDSTGIPDSTVAQVGKIKPVVPSSQVLDNEIWETWMEPLNDETKTFDAESFLEEQYHAQRNSISPGISEASFAFHGNRVTVSSEANSEIGRSLQVYNGDTGEEDEHYSPNVSSIRAPATKYLMASSPVACLEKTRMDPDDEVLQTTIIPGAKDWQNNSKKLPTKVMEEPDMDNVWKKFVFGSSSDASVSADRENQPLDFPARKLHSQSSSMFANGSPTRFVPRRFSRTLQSDSPEVNSTYPNVDGTPLHLNFSSGDVDSRHSEPHDTTPTERLSQFEKRPTSIHATQGSFPSSDSRKALASGETTPFRGPQRRVVFTKPKLFAGEKSDKYASIEEERPLYIGRWWNEPMEEDNGSARGNERDVYSLVGADDLVESIEDDYD